MRIIFYCTVVYLIIDPCISLFVPEQIPTLLSFLYSNIPPIRKGTDSKVGFGFRVGPNADFQVLFELGPQEETKPVGPNSDTSKREAAVFEEKVHKSSSSSSPWLLSWKHIGENTHNLADTNDNGASSPEKEMDPDVFNHLSQLYRKAKTNLKRSRKSSKKQT